MAQSAPAASTSLDEPRTIQGPDGSDPLAEFRAGVAPEQQKKTKKNPNLVQRLLARQWVKHLIAAFNRFTERLATQFAGAITYFTLLAIIPILMVAFGITATVLRGNQGALDTIKDKVAEQLPGPATADIIDKALTGGTALGIVGLVLALYSGIGWIGNVREAVQAQWRPTFEKSEAEKAQSFLSILLGNLITLVSLGAALLVSVVLTAVGGAAQNFVLGLLGLDDVGWLKPVVGIGTFVIVVAADVLIFTWFYTRMEIEDYTPPPRAVFKGAVIAAVVFEVLKVAMTFILPLLSGSATTLAFGSIITLLFFFNLVAQVVLFVAAWIGTAPGADDQRALDLPEIPGPPAREHREAPAKAAGLVGLGALGGFLLSRRRRR